jgi:hypothetical protein
MTEDEIRQLVREAVLRHLGPVADRHSEGQGADVRRHASHGMFVLPVTADGLCIIEPSVRCTHCGYCQSYGH